MQAQVRDAEEDRGHPRAGGGAGAHRGPQHQLQDQPAADHQPGAPQRGGHGRDQAHAGRGRPAAAGDGRAPRRRVLAGGAGGAGGAPATRPPAPPPAALPPAQRADRAGARLSGRARPGAPRAPAQVWRRR